MNITQKDFDKLKQLDRIEYRQKEDRIKNYGIKLSQAIPFFNFLLLFQFCLLVVLIKYNPHKIDIMFSNLALSISVCFFGYILIYILELIFYIKRKQMVEDLRKDYFNEKLEVKK